MKKVCKVCGIEYNEEEVQIDSTCPDCQKVSDTFDKSNHVPTEEEIEEELKTLIERFNKDDVYRRTILQRSNSRILKNNDSLDSAAEKRLIQMVIMSRY